MATLKDVALKAGVSYTTVSHVINNTRFVSKEVTKRVREAMDELGYKPNLIARSLRKKASKVIGLLMPLFLDDSNNSFFMKISQGIEEKLNEKGYAILISNNNSSLKEEIDNIRLFRSQMVSGIIIAPSCIDYNDDFFDEVGNLPVVFVDRKTDSKRVDHVLSDGYKGVYDTIKLMNSEGLKKIGYIGGVRILSTGNSRYLGYIDAFKDLGIGIDESIIKISESSVENGYTLMSELDKENCDSVIITSNAMLMGAYRYLVEKSNINKIKIVGFDNRIWTENVFPSISVISQNEVEIGRKAAEILLDKIENGNTEYRRIYIPTNLIRRQSF